MDEEERERWMRMGEEEEEGNVVYIESALIGWFFPRRRGVVARGQQR